MKNYTKPCVQKNYPDHIILHVGANELNSELPPERIAKSVNNVAKNLQTDSDSISILSIIPCKDDYNSKAMNLKKNFTRCVTWKSYLSWNTKTSIRKHIGIEAGFTSAEMISKNLIRTFQILLRIFDFRKLVKE